MRARAGDMIETARASASASTSARQTERGGVERERERTRERGRERRSEGERDREEAGARKREGGREGQKEREAFFRKVLGRQHLGRKRDRESVCVSLSPGGGERDRKRETFFRKGLGLDNILEEAEDNHHRNQVLELERVVDDLCSRAHHLESAVSIRRLLPPHTKQIKIEESICAGALRLGIQKTHKQKNQNQRIF